MKRLDHILLWAVCCVMAVMCGCRIEPPLKLPDEINTTGALGEVEVNLEVVWGIDADWQKDWWYGWDADDIFLYGPLAYTEPSNYEIRLFYLGDQAGREDWEKIDAFTVYSKQFRRKLSYGYHDLLVWSNIDSDDGTQVLRIDESAPRSVEATTSQSRGPISPGMPVHNYPEIFYGGRLDGIYIDKNPENYDYFDEEYQTWVKRIEADMYPLVYIYVVQVAIYNNNGRITGLAEDAIVSNMSRGVTVNSGHTHDYPVAVSYGMRMKRGLQARENRDADIIGGKLHTFGLCDMEPWYASRGAAYKGSRTELNNRLYVDFAFSNSTDSIFSYDITDQLQRQCHGGVITLEIDMDTVTIPSAPGGGSFDPIIAPSDTIVHEFPM